MAVKKATTKADLESVADENPAADKPVKVKSPTGAVTEVPQSILDALLRSGYSKSK